MICFMCILSHFLSGIMDSGIGYTAMAKFMTAINVPPPSEKCMKNRETEAGKAVEETAQESSLKAIDEEIQQSARYKTKEMVFSYCFLYFENKK